MTDDNNIPYIIWVHGMGDKPDRTTAPIEDRPVLEMKASWAPLSEALWLPIPMSAYQIAYWADIRQGVSAPAHPGEPPAAFRRPPAEMLNFLTARERSLMEFAYVQTPVEEGEQAMQGAPPWEQGRSAVTHSAKSAKRSWALLRDYIGRPHVLIYTGLAAILGALGTFGRRMNILRHLRIGRAIGCLLQDLYPYVNQPERVRTPVIQRVIDQLNKANGRPICLISQSMGTIVALDAIYQWQQTEPTGHVDTLVTLACPLGMEKLRNYVWPKGVGENEEPPTFPRNVGQWVNIYDTWDYVTMLDRGLANDFPEIRIEGEETFRIPRVIDIPTRPNNNRDFMREPHDWYGFLSSPQLADVVCHFWLGATVKSGLPRVKRGDQWLPPDHLLNVTRTGEHIDEDEAPAGNATREDGETIEATLPLSRATEHTDGEVGSG